MTGVLVTENELTVERYMEGFRQGGAWLAPARCDVFEKLGAKSQRLVSYLQEVEEGA